MGKERKKNEKNFMAHYIFHFAYSNVYKNCILDGEEFFIGEGEKMSRYIDADALKETMMQIANNSSMKKYIIDTYIDTAPTADVKPIVYGEWIHREELFDDEEKPRMVWGCKKCGFSLKSIHDKRNFCPNCGAKMKGEKL